MAERFKNLRQGWRLGAAITLLTGGFWYEGHAIDEGIHGNIGASAEFGIEGAILLGVGALTYNNHNRHMERIRKESLTTNINSLEGSASELKSGEELSISSDQTEKNT